MIRKIKNIVHKGLAVLANVRYGFPAKDLYVIGITGTDGKSTTAFYLYQILQQSGKKVAFIGTTGAIIEGNEEPLPYHVTTPSAFHLQKLIHRVKKAGTRFLVLEVTSHGIDQFRTWGIPIQIGILTNVSPEHLDYHKTMENYTHTKAKLLKKAQTAILGDDENGRISKLLKGKDVTRYGLGEDAQVNEKQFDIPPSLPSFNKKNMLGAIAAARYSGMTNEEINKVIPHLKLPKARLDTVYDKNFRIIIDFAHTPASFSSLLPEVKSVTKGRLIHVFGAAGGRDREKRRKMGEIASLSDDVIILTSEDPRHEDIGEINVQLMSGMKGFSQGVIGDSQKSKKILQISDRKKAILTAVAMAQKGDTVLLTGKGHERSQNIDGKEHPWDEYKAVQEAIADQAI